MPATISKLIAACLCRPALVSNWINKVRISLAVALVVVLGTAPGLAQGAPAGLTPTFAGAVVSLATLGFPEATALDSHGNLFVGFSSGLVEFVAVNGHVSASSALVTFVANTPVFGVAADPSGNIFFTEQNSSVYELVAVNGQVPSSATPAVLNASFGQAFGLASDLSGDIFVSDLQNNHISKIEASGGTVSASSTVTLIVTAIGQAYGIAVDAHGDLFAALPTSSQVIEIPAGATFQSVVNSTLVGPFGIAVDSQGDLYVSTLSGGYAIYEILQGTGGAAAGTVATGSTVLSIGGFNFNSSRAVALDQQGNLMVGDSGNNEVKYVYRNSVPFDPAAVGTTTPQQMTLNYTFTGTGTTTIGAPAVLTQGAPNLDFTDAGTGTCTTNGTSHSYAAGDTCTVVVSFNPTAPGQRLGAVRIPYGSGTSSLTTPVYGTGTGPLVVQAPGEITTVAGTRGSFGYSGDGAAATSATLNNSYGAATDGAGNLYIADSGNNVVRKVDTTGTITTVAGNGSLGFAGDGGSATNAELKFPAGAVVDGAGNLYIADFNNQSVRRVDAVTGKISTVAGNPANFRLGDGGPATSANLQPSAIAVDGAGDLYIADTFHFTVRRVDAATGIITTVAGGGTALSDGGPATGAKLSYPSAVTLDGSGNLYITDESANKIRMVTPEGIISTVAGNGSAGSSADGSVAATSSIYSPSGVAVDAAGNVYFAEFQSARVRMVSAETGQLLTVAGAQSDPFSGDGGPATAAGLLHPQSVTLDGADNLYISEKGNGVFRKVSTLAAPLSFGSEVDGGRTAAQTVTLENAGNATLSAVSPGLTLAADFPQVGSGGTTLDCTRFFTLAPGANCNVTVEFGPVAPVVGPVNELVVLRDNNLNAPSATQTISLTGTAVSPTDSTSTALASSSGSIGSGGVVNLTATVKDVTNSTKVPTGGVTFIDQVGSTTVSLNGGAAVALNGSGVATLNGATLVGDGVHTITANYVGVANTFTASSSTVPVTVGVATHLSLAATSPEGVGSSFTVAVTALDANNQLATGYAGTVKITSNDSAAVLPANVTLVNGVGTFTVTLKTIGNESIQATDTVASTLVGSIFVNVIPPPVFLVTVATDGTSGVAADCTDQSLNGAKPDASCSLRDAITAANASTIPATIQFASALTSGGAATITEGSAGTLTISTSMNIVGPGQKLLAIDGANSYRVIDIGTGVTVAISGVTVQHGNAPTQVVNGTTVTALTDAGGGIRNQGTLSITNTSISNNVAGSSQGGGVYSNGTLTIAGSSIAGNSAEIGGGIYSSSGGFVTISGSSISSDTSNGQGFINGGGGISGGGSAVSITNSTVFGNRNMAAGGFGGGISMFGGSLSLTNVTVSGNSAQFGAGISTFKTTSLMLLQSTISGNASSVEAGGLYLSGSPTTLRNTVVAGNTATTSSPNILTSALPTNGGGNYYDTTATSTLAPNLAALGNYGGATETQPALPGSPVACLGLASNVGSLTTDERGNPRIATYGSTQCVDAGAVQTAYSLAFVQQPTNAVFNQAITPAPTVQLSDNGVVSPLSGAPVTVSAAAGTLAGTTTQTTATGGLATFSNLSLPTVEANDTLTATTALTSTINLTATSGAFSIVQGTQTITFTPPTSPVTYGVGPITLSATGGASGNPVTFTVLSGPGSVTDSVLTVMGAGTIVVAANQVGNASYAAAAQVTKNIVVNQGTQTITFFPLTSPVAFGTGPIQLSALSSSGLPVAFTVVSGPGIVSGSTLTVTGAGTIVVAANQAGNTNYAAAPQVLQSVVVNPATQTISFTAPPASVTFGASPIALVGNSSSGLAVSFSVVSGPGTVTGSTLTITGAGTVVVAANQAGNTNYTAATPVTKSIVVQKATPVATWATPAAIGYGTPLSATQLNASVTGVGGTPLAGTSVYLPAAGSVPGAGPHTLSLTFTPTDTADYNAVTASVVLTVQQSAPKLTWATPAAISYGVPLSATQLNASVTGAGGTALAGNIVYTPALGSFPAAGTQTLRAVFTPTDTVDYTTQTGTVSLTVNKASSTLSGPVATGQSIQEIPGVAGSVAVTVVGQFTGSQIAVPTGQVAYTIVNGANITAASGSVALTPGALSSTASVPVPTTLAPGLYSVNLVYGGDRDFAAAAQSTVTLEVGQLQPIVKWPAPAAIVYGSSVGAALDAIALNGTTSVPGTIVYTATPAGGVAAVVSAATVLPAGSYTLNATFTPTDTTTYKSAAGTVSLVVNKAQDTVGLAASASSVLVQNAVVFTATVGSAVSTPTGSVTFLDTASTAPLGSATLVNGVAVLSLSTLTVGSHSITAVYSGDANFLGVTSGVVSETVEDFNLNISTSAGSTTSQTIVPGGTADYTLIISPTGSPTFPAAVALSVSGLPAGATYTLTPSTIAAGAGTTNVTLAIQVPNSTAKLELRDRLGRGLAPIALGLLLLPFSRSMRRSAKKLGRVTSLILLLLLGAGAVAGLTGCGTSSGYFGQSQQTYSVSVTGTSGALVHSTTVTLTVQ